MEEYSEIKCPNCDQQLRLPSDIGGMLMACPSCGGKFHTDFKLANKAKRSLGRTIFEMPSEIVTRIHRYLIS